MKTSQYLKLSIVAVVAGMMLMPMSAAMAQEVGEGTRATTDEILEGGLDRLERQAEEEEERQVETDLDAESRVTLSEVDVDERSAEELDRLKRELEQAYGSQIERFRELIERQPYDDRRPNWMFQQAELLWELRNMEYIRMRAEFNACLDAVYQGTLDESECDEPQPEYDEPQAIYEAILQEFPDYNRLDEVIFRLGSGLLDAGEGAQAVGYLQRLVQNYPNSRYLADANLALGEFFFDEQLTGAAKDYYEAVLEFPNYRNHAYAIYKLGWTHYNMGEHRESADRFREVIEGADSAAWSFLENQAANDLMLALAELDDGWIEARDYFTDMRGIDFAYTQLDRMAGYLELQGFDTQAIAVYDWFMEERPNHRSVPDWMDAIARSLRDVDFATYEERVNQYVAYLHPDGTWRQHNQDEERAIRNSRLFVESNLARLANHYHRNAQRSAEREISDEEIMASYVYATEYYQQFIDWFPNHPASFDMTFFLGEIFLHRLERLEQAAEQYQIVVNHYNNDNVPADADPEDVLKIVRDSAYNIVYAYNLLVREHHPESVLVDMASRAGEDPELTIQSVDEIAGEEAMGPAEREDLLEWEEHFVRASDQFSEMFPDEDDTPTVDYVAAEVYRSRGHYDNCIPRYESIIQNAPQHRYASFAGNSLLEANYRLQRWDDVERWARHLLENEIFDVTPASSLTSAIAYAINERARNLMDADEHDQASDELLRLAAEFPDSDLAPGALFNAALIAVNGNRINRAVDIYTQVVDEYPDAPQASQSLIYLGEIFESRADFARAADHFGRLAEDAYRSNENAADAVYNAARLREAMEEWDHAIATYEDYLTYFDDQIEDQNEVLLLLAFLEKNREEWGEAERRFRAYLQRDGIAPGEHVEIHLELGLLAQRMQPSGWEELADEHFTRTQELWRELEEESDRTRLRHQAAQARFLQGEVILQAYRDVELAFPPDLLSRRFNEKNELRGQASAVYMEVIEMRSPRWAAAAAFRIGQSYQEFAEALFALPIPDDVPDHLIMDYELAIEDRAFPLQERALAAFESALQIALRNEAYNEWSARSAATISELQPASFPITEQDGVTVEHSRTEFFSPAPVTDMEVVLERGAPRWERLRPPPEPEIDPEMEGQEPAEASQAQPES